MSDTHQSMSELKPTDHWKRFLEAAAPNVPVKIPGLLNKQSSGKGIAFGVNCPVIELHCARDGGSRRFNCDRNLTLDSFSFRSFRFIKYTCRDCQLTARTFAVVFEWDPFESDDKDIDVEVMKLGEYPPFSAPISPQITNLLTKPDLEFYRKGARAIDQGLGIGAASYFRRIVESQWERLVRKTREAAEQLEVTDLSAYDKALESHQFASAVESLEDAIPEKLLILNGQNPLTLLYRPLSEQLHKLSDEECLQQARDIQLILNALLENIAAALEEEKELQAAVRRLQGPAKPNNE